MSAKNDETGDSNPRDSSTTGFVGIVVWSILLFMVFVTFSVFEEVSESGNLNSVLYNAKT